MIEPDITEYTKKNFEDTNSSMTSMLIVKGRMMFLLN